jgi:hypothetical protein
MQLSGFRKYIQWVGILPLLLLAGCSPHPGSGTWVPVPEEETDFSMLQVHYNGRAELLSKGKDAIIRHCFWVGIGKKSIKLDCVPSNNTGIEEQFQLNVVAEGEAELMFNGKVAGRFSWSQPEQ